MYVFIHGRRYGKTLAALEWAEQAQLLEQAPFWDRVIVTATKKEAERLRAELRKRAELRGDPEDPNLLDYKVQSGEENSHGRIQEV
jgi:3-deoxy-D-manno-octulosonic-acid transferase